ncbi:hypothetical protein BOTNAR_2213g00010 [Botryotinia narcissicola]|uniref:Uncharacterized protein n=1 Tax=Botryotinia narcissicola TaxID=278944 RepID=A0A4Z1H4Z3_9HELO|nr:hypothetical protein BOTNAR_2213g00010 [Botryotinia narcissicola]
MAPTSKASGNNGKKPEKKEPVKASSSDPKEPCPTCRRQIKKSKMKDHTKKNHDSSDEDGGTSLPAGRYGAASSGWINKKCSPCGDGRIYTSREAYNRNIASEHSDIPRNKKE